jgi:hypothetical protein
MFGLATVVQRFMLVKNGALAVLLNHVAGFARYATAVRTNRFRGGTLWIRAPARVAGHAHQTVAGDSRLELGGQGSNACNQKNRLRQAVAQDCEVINEECLVPNGVESRTMTYSERVPLQPELIANACVGWTREESLRRHAVREDINLACRHMHERTQVASVSEAGTTTSVCRAAKRLYREPYPDSRGIRP